MKNMMRMVWGMACVFLLFGGSIESFAEETKPKPPPEIIKEGKILVVRGERGGEPQLTDSEGKRWLITGDTRDEVLHLNGHRIKVWAASGAKKHTLSTLKVRQYEIVDSGGRKPMVGVLKKNEKEDLFLEGKEVKLKVKVSRALAKHLVKRIDCKVWLAGKIEDQSIKVYKFGWLKCDAKKNIKPRKESSK